MCDFFSIFSCCCQLEEPDFFIDETGEKIALRKKFVNKDGLSRALKKHLKKGVNYPKDFLSLAKAKKVLLTQEQKAAMEREYDILKDKSSDAMERDIKIMDKKNNAKDVATDIGNDVLPLDFKDKVAAFLLSKGDLKAGESIDALALLGAPVDLIGTLKAVGSALAYVTPAAETMGKYSAKLSMKGDYKPGGIKPEEAIHFKAIESGLLDRYQIGQVIQRRPSVSAFPCAQPECTESTFHLTGYCSEHLDLDIQKQFSSKHLENLSGPASPTSVDSISRQLSTTVDKSRSQKKLEHFISATELRKEMTEKASKFITSPKIQKTTDAGRAAFRSPIFQEISDDDVAQMYSHFKLLDLDGDGFITLSDLKRLVAYIDPKLPSTSDFQENCQKWFGRQTFYPNLLATETVAIKVDFEDYVTALLNFRMLTKKYQMVDNLNFPFWSLRDCIVYSCHRHLDGWAYKRGSGITGFWKKRHFRMCKDDTSGSNISLEYYENDENDAPIRKSIDLRMLLSVTFSPKTTPPKGEDIPEELIVFKLLLNNGSRITLAAEKPIAIQWTAIFSNYALAGRLITEWRIQYGNLTKDKITTRDWINAGIVVVNMTSYLQVQTTYKEQIAAADEHIKSKKLTGSAATNYKASVVRSIIRIADKCYTPPKERLILKLVGISESNLQNSLIMVQCGISCWRGIKYYVWALDDAYCFGGVRLGIFVVKNGVVAYKYGVNAKNEYKKNRYGVEWVDRSSARECAVCKEVFKSATIRSEFKKHHCRSCGRIVCHGCSTKQMYFEVSEKVKRVCDECLVTGTFTKNINPLDPAKTQKKITFREVEDSDDSDDEEEDADGLEGVDEFDIGEDSSQGKALANLAKSTSGQV